MVIFILLFTHSLFAISETDLKSTVNSQYMHINTYLDTFPQQVLESQQKHLFGERGKIFQTFLQNISLKKDDHLWPIKYLLYADYGMHLLQQDTSAQQLQSLLYAESMEQNFMSIRDTITLNMLTEKYIIVLPKTSISLKQKMEAFQKKYLVLTSEKLDIKKITQQLSSGLEHIYYIIVSLDISTHFLETKKTHMLETLMRKNPLCIHKNLQHILSYLQPKEPTHQMFLTHVLKSQKTECITSCNLGNLIWYFNQLLSVHTLPCFTHFIFTNCKRFKIDSTLFKTLNTQIQFFSTQCR